MKPTIFSTVVIRPKPKLTPRHFVVRRSSGWVVQWLWRLDGPEFDSRPPLLYWIGDPLWAGKPPQHFIEPPRPAQPPTLSQTGNKYRPKCGDALRLGSKSSFHKIMWTNLWAAGKTVWSLVNMCQPERFRGEYHYGTHYKALYQCPVYLLYLLYIVYSCIFGAGVV